MTIEGIVCRRGAKTDLYHPTYFKSAEDLVRLIAVERVYLYGWHHVNNTVTTVVVDTKKCVESLTADAFILTSRYIYLNIEVDSKWTVEKPDIPPEQGWLSDSVKVDMWSLRIRFLHERDDFTPRYYSLEQSTNIIPRIKPGDSDLYLCKSSSSFSTHKSIFFVNGLCCKPERYTDEDYGDAVKLKNGRWYLKNQKDRNRGVVIVDFSSFADVEFIPLSSCRGTIDSFKLPSTVDPDNHSFLLVVDGRLFLQDEFVLLSSGRVLFDASKYRDIYALDRLCCSNTFKGVYTVRDFKAEEDNIIKATQKSWHNSRVLVTDKPNLYKSANSFMIVIKRKGLKVIKHGTLRGPDETQLLNEPVTNEQFSHITFDGSAAGILFDCATRSVTDYTQEENDQDLYIPGVDIKYMPTGDTKPIDGKTYYIRTIDGNSSKYENWGLFEKYLKKTSASVGERTCYTLSNGCLTRYTGDTLAANTVYYVKLSSPLEEPVFEEGIFYFESKPLPQRWYTKMLYLKHNTPLERWGNPNNVMSASASMHDNKTVRGDAQVIWPRYTMLDFIFEG